MLTDEAQKKHIGTFEAHLANVRHFLFLRANTASRIYFLHLTNLLTCLVRDCTVTLRGSTVCGGPSPAREPERPSRASCWTT